MSDLNPTTVMNAVDDILEGCAKTGVIPNLWYGHAAERITNILIKE